MEYNDSFMLEVYRSRNYPQVTVFGKAPTPQDLANEKMEDRAFLSVYIHQWKVTCDLLLSPNSKFEVLADGSLLFEATNFWVFNPENQKRGQKKSLNLGLLKFTYSSPPKPNGGFFLVGVYGEHEAELYIA